MTETAVVSARMDSDLKRSAEQIFKEMGLSAAQAIRLFYGEVDRAQLPFEDTERRHPAGLREAERVTIFSFDSADECSKILAFDEDRSGTSQFKQAPGAWSGGKDFASSGNCSQFIAEQA